MNGERPRGGLKDASWLVLSGVFLIGCAQSAEVGQSREAGLVDAAPESGTLDAVADRQPDRPVTDAASDADLASDCDGACVQAALCFGPDVLDECRMLCTSPGAAAVVVSCDMRRMGCTYPPDCSTGVSSECEDNCQQLSDQMCIDGLQLSECFDGCETANPSTVDSFNACVDGSCQDDRCYRILVPEPGPDVAGCRMGCDTLQFFDCIGPSQHSMCRDLCGRATRSAADTFISCTQGVCSSSACYDVFRASVGS
ncbi:MAG: hypothetical protein AAGF12_11235 [Myxococcota bacterium]